MINELIFPKPDDMHLHLREDELLKVVSKHSATQFGRAIIMPNLQNPIINSELAHKYYDEVKNHTKAHDFEPLMTIYFNEKLTLEELKRIQISSKIMLKLHSPETFLVLLTTVLLLQIIMIPRQTTSTSAIFI